MIERMWENTKYQKNIIFDLSLYEFINKTNDLYYNRTKIKKEVEKNPTN